MYNVDYDLIYVQMLTRLNMQKPQIWNSGKGAHHSKIS